MRLAGGSILGIFTSACACAEIRGRTKSQVKAIGMATTVFFFFAVLCGIFARGSTQCPIHNGYFAHERNCDMYYECENGTRHEGICPDGLVFDDQQPSEKLICDLPFRIDCSYRTALQPPLSTEHCPRRWGMYAHEVDCTRFWNCVDGHAHAFYCPEGLAYNEYSAHCDWPDLVEDCDPEVMFNFRCPPATDDDIQYFGDPRYPFPGDCRKHYVCILTPAGTRKPRLLACDPGLVFNSATSLCDDPENVSGCQNYYSNLDAKRLRELFGR